jgi:purine nucleoside permease
MFFARTASLEDSAAAAKNRALYSDSPSGVYHASTLDPSIVEGDVTSGNVFFHGSLLCEGFEKIVKLYTSGKAKYYMTAQEDMAIMAALLRAALQKQVDFSRIILMRAGSNFGRSDSSNEPPSIPFVLDHGGFALACRNLYLSGFKVVDGILEGWSSKFENGVEAKNYIGDVFGSLGWVIDFGPEKDTLNAEG